ncbi:MAG: NACHT domain-containing protein [Anaerolineales bacterium]|nr:NACHT domain-containing protein [Anaerolineales bacterium]
MALPALTPVIPPLQCGWEENGRLPHPLPTRYNRRSQPTMRVAGRRFAQPALFQTTMTVLARLRDLFTNLDSNKDSAKLLAYDLGLPVARINFDGAAASAWDSLLQVAHQQGQIPALIALASRDAFRGAAPQLAELLRQYREAYPAATPDGEARLLAKYQEWVRQEHDQIQILGMSRPVPLSSIYTDVWLRDREVFSEQYTLDALQEQFLQWRESQEEGERRGGLAVAQQERRLFIMGKPGAGKSTLMRHLVLQAAQGEAGLPPLPVFISVKALADSGMELLDYLVQEVEIGCEAECRDWMERLLREGQVLVLLDGLDETSRSDGDRGRMQQMIEAFARRFHRSQFIVTCRIDATDHQFRGFVYVEVADFTLAQIETFVTNWFAAEAPETGKEMLRELKQTEQKGITDLTKTPLLLTLLCLAYRKEGKFSQRRADVYQQAFDYLLSTWDDQRGIERGETIYGQLSPGRREELLAWVAYETFRQGEYFIAQDRLIKLLLDYLEGVPGLPARIDMDGKKLLKAIIAQHGVFVERAYATFSFSHLTFQEYFAAKYLVDNVNQGVLAELVSYSDKDRWQDVFLLVVSMLPNAELFFSLFLEALARPIAADETLVNLLNKVNRATNYKSLESRKPAAIRSWYLYLDLDLAPDLDRDLHLDLACVLARALALAPDPVLVLDIDLILDVAIERDRALNRIRDFALNLDRIRERALNLDPDLERDYALTVVRDLDRDLDRVHNLAFNLDPVRALGLDLKLDTVFALDFDLARALARALTLDLAVERGGDLDLIIDIVLVSFYNGARIVARYGISKRQQISRILPVLHQGMDKAAVAADKLGLTWLTALLQQEPWPGADAPDASWQAFVKMLATALRERGFDPKRELTEEQWQIVVTYLRGNKLLLDCLDLATVRDRAAIEAQMLLPPNPTP